MGPYHFTAGSLRSSRRRRHSGSSRRRRSSSSSRRRSSSSRRRRRSIDALFRHRGASPHLLQKLCRWRPGLGFAAVVVGESEAEVIWDFPKLRGTFFWGPFL